jgi:hypothetical protein
MSIILVYLLALALTPLAARIALDQRAAMAVFIAEIAAAIVVCLGLGVAAAFAEGIWPHLDVTAATPSARSFSDAALIFGMELAQFLWRYLLQPVLAAFAGAVAAVLWQFAAGMLRYRVGKRRYRRKRISLGLSTRGF